MNQCENEDECDEIQNTLNNQILEMAAQRIRLKMRTRRRKYKIQSNTRHRPMNQSPVSRRINEKEYENLASTFLRWMFNKHKNRINLK
jgi:GH24 family phage-related lysozyme (muramidase)